MNKRIFMKKLRRALWRFNVNEIDEIISDYNEFFTVGISEGKTEEELCEQFGSPKDIILKIKSENTKNNFFKKMLFLRILFLLIFISYMAVFLKDINNNVHVLGDSLLGVFVLLISLWAILGGEFLKYPPVVKHKLNVNTRLLLFLHIVLTFLTLVIYILSFYFFNNIDLLYKKPFNLTASDIGPFITGFYCSMLILGFFILIFSFYEFVRYSVKFYTVICNSLGFIMFLINLINIHRNINNESQLFYLLNGCLSVYIVSIIFAFIINGHINRIYDKRRPSWMPN